jgi:ABC-type amino acid transport substrate-binding protein
MTQSYKDPTVIIVGTGVAYPPFVFLEEEKIVGFDKDVMDAISNEIKTKIEYRIIDNVLVNVENGNIDVGIGGISITEDRKNRVNFTNPYYTNRVVVVVKKDSDFEKIIDLDGKKVGTWYGTTNLDIAMDIKGAEIVKVDEDYDLYSALIDGKVDAIITDKALNDYLTKGEYENKIKIIGRPLSIEDFGYIVTKDNIDLLNKLNYGLRGIMDNGVFDEIYDKWINEQ